MATWKIVSMITAKQAGEYTDVVQQVNWLVIETANGYEAVKGGSTVLPTPDATFTPYAQLTETEVLGWVQTILGADEIALIEANLASQLLYMQNPPITALPLPWA